jgi:hypothetical protein
MSKSHDKKKGMVTITKASADVVELWNELTNGLGSFNSLAKVDVALIVQKKRHNKESLAKGFKAMGQATSCTMSGW